MLDKTLIEQYAKINALMVRCVAMQTANQTQDTNKYSEEDFNNLSKQIFELSGSTVHNINYEEIEKIWSKKKKSIVEIGMNMETGKKTIIDGNDNLKFCNIDGKLQDNIMMIRITGDDDDSKHLSLFYKVLDAVKSAGLSVEITKFGGEIVNHQHGV